MLVGWVGCGCEVVEADEKLGWWSRVIMWRCMGGVVICFCGDMCVLCSPGLNGLQQDLYCD